MIPILFNHQLLLDLEGKSQWVLAALCPDAKLEDLLNSRLIKIDNGKFVITAMGRQMIDFEKKNRTKTENNSV